MIWCSSLDYWVEMKFMFRFLMNWLYVGYGGGSFNRLSGSNNNGGGELSFSSLLPSSLGMLSHISEQVIGNEKLTNTNGEPQFFTPTGFPFASWNESSQFSEPFPVVKHDPDSNRKLFSSSHQVWIILITWDDHKLCFSLLCIWYQSMFRVD